MEEAVPPKRTEWWPILLLVLAIGGSAVGVAVYQRSQARPPALADGSGFDLAQTTEAKRSLVAPAATAPGSGAAAPSSLTGASWGAALRSGSAAGPDPLKSAAASFADVCRANEDRVRAMAERYTRQSPVIQAYGKEWMSYPDLKKLNDDYMVQHDPVAFLHGVAASKNFATMVRKYAGYPVFLNFVQEAMKAAPADARQVAMDYIDKDKVASEVMDKVLQSLGLPTGLLGSNTAKAGEAPNIDPTKLLNSMMGSNPALQNSPASPMNDPEFQKRVQAIKPN